MRNALRFNTAGILETGGALTFSDGVTPLPALTISTLNLLITAWDYATGATTVISNTAASTTGTYATNYIAGTNRFSITFPAALTNRYARITTVLSNATSIVPIEDSWDIEPAPLFDAFELGIATSVDIGQ